MQEGNVMRTTLIWAFPLLSLAVGHASVAQGDSPVDIDYATLAREALRHSHLVGSNEDLAIELPNGELRPLTRKQGCLPPVSKGGMIEVDCTVSDGPAYYFDETSRSMIEVCSFWNADPKRCPPKQWPITPANCEGRVSADITGSWHLDSVAMADGFAPVSVGPVIRITDSSVFFGGHGALEVERSYSIVSQSDRRYELRLTDDMGESLKLGVELTACGLVMESDTLCGAFCENLRDEWLDSAGDAARQLSNQFVSPADRRLPIFPPRSLFRPGQSD